MTQPEGCFCALGRESPLCPGNPWGDVRFEMLERAAPAADVSVRCRGCGAIWDIVYIHGGGLYGDHEWTRRPAGSGEDPISSIVR
jgi:hypothetical protein